MLLIFLSKENEIMYYVRFHFGKSRWSKVSLAVLGIWVMSFSSQPLINVLNIKSYMIKNPILSNIKGGLLMAKNIGQKDSHVMFQNVPNP